MLRGQLYATALSTTFESGLDNEAAEFYRKLTKKMRRAALTGAFDIPVNLPENEALARRICNMLKADGLEFKNGQVSWKPQYPEVPRITARDLVQMGYNPADGDLFRRILDSVRQGLAEGLVSNQTVDSQILWVKQRFPLK